MAVSMKLSSWVSFGIFLEHLGHRHNNTTCYVTCSCLITVCTTHWSENIEEKGLSLFITHLQLDIQKALNMYLFNEFAFIRNIHFMYFSSSKVCISSLLSPHCFRICVFLICNGLLSSTCIISSNHIICFTLYINLFINTL